MAPTLAAQHAHSTSRCLCVTNRVTDRLFWCPICRWWWWRCQVKDYPGYNFIGLILGPRGNTQKRMEQVRHNQAYSPSLTYLNPASWAMGSVWASGKGGRRCAFSHLSSLIQPEVWIPSFCTCSGDRSEDRNPRQGSCKRGEGLLPLPLPYPLLLSHGFHVLPFNDCDIIRYKERYKSVFES